MKLFGGDTKMALSEVFSNISYILLAGTLTLFALAFAILLPNLGLIARIFNNTNASLTMKFSIVGNLLLGIQTNFTMFSAGYTIAIALLFGLNLAMIIYLIAKQRSLIGGKTLSVGMGGVLSGLLGIGCASCGAFLLTAVLSSIGAISLLAYLPLHGGELGVLGVVLLLISLVLVSKKITKPTTCKI